MKKDQEDQARAQQAAVEELQRQLRPRFKDLPSEVPLFLFTSPGRNEHFAQATHAGITSFYLTICSMEQEAGDE